MNSNPLSFAVLLGSKCYCLRKHCQAIDKIKIDRNREEGGFLGLGKDLAELELWSFIVTDNQTPPDVSKLLLTTTELRAKKELVANITKTVLGTRQIRKIDKIKDGAEMNFGFDLRHRPVCQTFLVRIYDITDHVWVDFSIYSD